MLAAGSPGVDHAAFSWMPASNALIYCAWLAEIGFALVFRAAGFVGLFALRCAAVLSAVALLAVHARALGLLRRAETWLVLLIVVLGSVVGSLIKPEMLSLVLWNANVFCGFGFLRTRSTLALYALPAILLVWVNTHGAFILAAPFVSIVLGVGLAGRESRHAVLAGLLCRSHSIRLALPGAAGAGEPGRVRPAGHRLEQRLPTHARRGRAGAAPTTTGCADGGRSRLSDLGGRQRRWALLAPFAVYLPPDFAYVRATFLLPPLFGYAALTLVADIHLPRWSTAMAAGLFCVLGLGSVAEAARHPAPGGWMGFGIDTSQPVTEAEFLARSKLGPRILNTYNAGGYLLWRLWPRDRVMVDARSFPYLALLDELRTFTGTTDPAAFAAFLQRHRGDVALVDFQEETVWRSFLRQPGWRPAFDGPAAAVFVPADRAPAAIEAAPTLRALQNGSDGRRLFDFAIAVGDYRTAWQLLDQLEVRLRPQVEAGDLRRMAAYRDAHRALAAGQGDRAWGDFAAAFHPASGRARPAPATPAWRVAAGQP